MSKMRAISFSHAIAATLLLSAAPLHAQDSDLHRRWNDPVEPFRIAGNVYYVGASDLTSFLIVTPAGHILIDSGLAETAPQILQNIARLGFDPRQVRILLNTQAHFDHIGGMALLRHLTGAQLIMSREDAALAARGGAGDFAFGEDATYAPVKADRIVDDGEIVTLGGVSLTAHITPGHTRGCTTWGWRLDEAEGGHEVAVLCSVTVPGYQLFGNAAYPEIVDDYRASFRKLRELSPDIFLASHGSFFGLKGKQQRLKRESAGNPFVAPREWHAHLDAMETAFEEQLSRETEGM